MLQKDDHTQQMVYYQVIIPHTPVIVVLSASLYRPVLAHTPYPKSSHLSCPRCPRRWTKRLLGVSTPMSWVSWNHMLYSCTLFPDPITICLDRWLQVFDGELYAKHLVTFLELTDTKHHFHLDQTGDKICLFGFSRGAYTARSLAGMIQKAGITLVDPTLWTD